MFKMFGPVVITLFIYISGVMTKDITVKINTCKKGDTECLTKTFKDIYPVVLAGIPSLGVDKTDPMFFDEIEGNFPTLKYKYINSTVRGLKYCAIKKLTFSSDMSNTTYELDCPKLSISGNYEMNGTLISLPVEGKGTFNTVTGRYLIQVDVKLNMFTGNDNKTHTKVKDISLKMEALEPVKFDFKNLFNGQKDLSDAAHKFAHENWKELSEFLQEPIFRKNIDLMYFNIDKLTKVIPLEEFFSD